MKKERLSSREAKKDFLMKEIFEAPVWRIKESGRCDGLLSVNDGSRVFSSSCHTQQLPWLRITPQMRFPVARFFLEGILLVYFRGTGSPSFYSPFVRWKFVYWSITIGNKTLVLWYTYANQIPQFPYSWLSWFSPCLSSLSPPSLPSFPENESGVWD